ncbi:MAG: hypothetical protein HC897_09965 [Thermoanaerobaculia bacterium]|nr:hypothetical protein [Thermoanaerobaculia bacterium]
MATGNFSVPDQVKDELNQTSTGENKSAVIARLMPEAVEQRRCVARRAAAADALLALRRELPAVSDAEIARARRALRS